MARARQGSLYDGSNVTANSNSNFTTIGIDMNSSNYHGDGITGSNSGGSMMMNNSWTNGSRNDMNIDIASSAPPVSQQQYHQQQHSSGSLPQPVLHKRPSTSQMQGVQYYGVPGSSSTTPTAAAAGGGLPSPLPSTLSTSSMGSSGGGFSPQHRQHHHHHMMPLSPGIRSSAQYHNNANASSSIPASSPSMPAHMLLSDDAGGVGSTGYDYSPVMQADSSGNSSGNPFYTPSAGVRRGAAANSQMSPGPSSSNINNDNIGLGVSSSYNSSKLPSVYATSPTAGPSSLLIDDQRHQIASSSSSLSSTSNPNQQHLARPSNLFPSSSASYSNAQQQQHRQFIRSNSSASAAALSISTSPTTAGPGSPMTPNSPSGHSSEGNTMRGISQQQQQQQQQYSYYGRGNPALPPSQGVTSQTASMSSLDQHQQMRRPSLQQVQHHSSSLSTYNNNIAGASAGMNTINTNNHNDHRSQSASASAQAQAQYAAYLEDPMSMSGLDRRIGSYSPSRYAIAAGNQGSGFNLSPQQQFQQQQQQQQQYHQGQGQPLQQSPRHPQQTPSYFSPGPSSASLASPVGGQGQHGTSATSNTLPPLQQSMQQHRQSVSLSPSYSRQGLHSASAAYPPQSASSSSSSTTMQGQQPIASSSMAPSSSSTGVGTANHAYSPVSATSVGSSTGGSGAGIIGKGYHARTNSYNSQTPGYPSDGRLLSRQRPRSAGSAFRQVRTSNDLRPGQHSESHLRRADPDGGVVSPLKALTTQLSQTYHLVNPNFRYEFSLNPRRVLTKPSKPCGNNGYDNEDCDYILYVNDVLGSEGNKYLILDVLGQGTFGQVVKCQNLKTHEIVGVKVIKNKEAYAQQSTMEIMILDILNGTYDPEDKHHILRLKDSFTHQKHLCLVFELLSSNLYELIKQNSFRGLSLSLVRVFTEQLLDALCVLKEAKLIHCDLKPENILLKTLQSPDIKVIDFGSACHEKQTVYTYIQSRFYRSPEVLLGLPYSTSIDMWSLGCICVELFLGLPLFPGTSEFNQITRIVEMLGLPPTYMLETGKQVHNFFNFYYDNYGQKRWQLKSIEEYSREHPTAKEQPSKKFFSASTLPEIVKQYPNQRKNLTASDLDRESQNRQSFIDFVSGLLNMNPMERWTPQQARLHPFVQNKEFTGPFAPTLSGYQSNNSLGGGISPRVKESAQDRPYGGLPPTPARTSTQTYHDAASYQQHLNQQQAHNASASANAYRQSQFSTNPYALPPASAPAEQPASQQRQSSSYSVPKLPPVSVTAPRMPGSSQHSPSHSMNASSAAGRSVGAPGPLSPNVPMGPPQAHQYPVRGRSGTFSQLDVPPALQKLGVDLSSFKAIGTPQLRRDDQRAAWERRHANNSELDRRRSLKQSNPHLEHLEYYAQAGHPAGFYYPSNVQQPFSIVVDPRMSDPSRQHISTGPGVTVPPQAYSGHSNLRYSQPPTASQSMQQGASVGPYDAFDQYDGRDGLNAMMHQPLLPTQAASNPYYPQNQGVYPAGPAYNYVEPIHVPENMGHSNEMPLPPNGGRQKRSDQQMWP